MARNHIQEKREEENNAKSEEQENLVFITTEQATLNGLNNIGGKLQLLSKQIELLETKLDEILIHVTPK